MTFTNWIKPRTRSPVTPGRSPRHLLSTPPPEPPYRHPDMHAANIQRRKVCDVENSTGSAKERRSNGSRDRKRLFFIARRDTAVAAAAAAFSRLDHDVVSGVFYVGVGLLAVGCYANGLRGEFVHDDVMAIVKNPDVRAESSVGELWSHDFWGQKMSSDVSHKSYRPLTVMTFR